MKTRMSRILKSSSTIIMAVLCSILLSSAAADGKESYVDLTGNPDGTNKPRIFNLTETASGDTHYVDFEVAIDRIDLGTTHLGSLVDLGCQTDDDATAGDSVCRISIAARFLAARTR